MSTHHVTELPDPILGTVDVGLSSSTRLSVSSSNTASSLLHAHIGPFYIAMSEQNWRILFAALSELEVDIPPRNFRIVFDDDKAEAHAVQVTR